MQVTQINNYDDTMQVYRFVHSVPTSSNSLGLSQFDNFLGMNASSYWNILASAYKCNSPC